MREALGRWFDRQQEKSKSWLVVFILFLALLAVANIFFHPVGGGHGEGHGDGHAQVEAEHDTHAAPAEHDTHAAPAHGEEAGGSVFWTRPHAHFGLDQYPEFFPLFGLLGAVIMVIFVKKIAQPVIEVPEDPDDV